jgi:hypothetical protein
MPLREHGDLALDFLQIDFPAARRCPGEEMLHDNETVLVARLGADGQVLAEPDV